MDFFLEIHNGECGLGGHFCYHQRDHGPSVLTVSTQNRESRIQKSEPGQGNEQGECTLLITF